MVQAVITSSVQLNKLGLRCFDTVSSPLVTLLILSRLCYSVPPYKIDIKSARPIGSAVFLTRDKHLPTPLKKRDLLEQLDKKTLQKLVAEFELPVRSNASANTLVEALVAKRGIKLNYILPFLSLPELRTGCELLGLGSKGKKAELLAVLYNLLQVQPQSATNRTKQIPATKKPAAAKLAVKAAVDTQPKQPNQHRVTPSMANMLTLQQLESFLWQTADILRGNMDASEFKDYIFGMMFLKRLSDAFDESREAVIDHYLAKGKSQAQAEELAEDEDEYDSTFFMPPEARWGALKDLKHDIGAELNKATEAIEEHNASLEGVLVSIDFNIKNKLSDKKLRDLLSHFNQHRLRNCDFERPDLLGTAYEYLIKMFADSAGKKGGEFYTPGEVVQLLVALLKPHAGMRIYDPTAGSGGMLVQTRNYLAEHGENPANLSLYGQEMNLNTWAICKMNMFLHGVFSADIRKGDTLREPQHSEGGQLLRFDRVIANPPFSLKKWGKDECDNDAYGRFPYGTPPKDAGDLAFVQHMIASTNAEGMAGIVMPHGVLFRGSSEKAVRQGMLEDDLLEAVVGLPSALFYGTGIPACLLIINKNKPAERKGKVLFINSELEFEEGKNQNKLRPQDIAKIVDTFDNYAEIKRYSRVVPLSEIADNDYNLNIRRYADTSPPPEIFDVRAILHGGVPVREVEDEYIQEEILQGYDISAVLVKRDSAYMDFAPAITAKEMIREQLPQADAKVVAQLERWWDKYKVSLHELDEQVADAEAVMKGFLVELGYE